MNVMFVYSTLHQQMIIDQTIMRNMVTIMATLLIVLSAAASNATASRDSLFAGPQCKLFSLDDRQFRMIYAGSAEQNVHVQIKDDQDRLLYKSKLEADGFARDFNLSFLPDGDYTFVLESGEYTYEKSVSISEAEMLSDLQQRFQASKLVLSSVAGEAYALIGTNNSGAVLEYSLSDEAGQRLYKGAYDADVEIKDLFTFQGVNGDVTMKFYLDGNLVGEKTLAFN